MNQKLPSCEVIIGFKVNDLDTIAKSIELKNTDFLTDSMFVEQELGLLGYPVHYIEHYFTEIVGTSLDAFYEVAITNCAFMTTRLGDTKYCQVPLIEGLRAYLLERMVLLEKMKLILESKKSRDKNVILLFSGMLYYHFAIASIAKELGYTSRFGVSAVVGKDSDSRLKSHYKKPLAFIRPSQKNLEPLVFRHVFASRYASIYDYLSGKEQIKSAEHEEYHPTVSLEEVMKGIVNHDSKYAFFLIDNEVGYYLKPVVPVISEFIEQKVGHVIFTFSSRTTEPLAKMNFRTNNLSPVIDALVNKMIQDNREIIVAFLSRAVKLPSITSVTLGAYLAYFSNDYIISNIARVMATIIVLKTIFEKFKFKSIFVGADGASENDLACSIGKSAGIPTNSIPPGIMEYFPIFRVLYNADRLFVDGPLTKKELTRLGVDERRLVITGNPRYDYIHGGPMKAKTIHSSNGGSEVNNGSKARPLIVFAMSRMHKDDERWFIAAIKFCNSKNLDILIKLHPSFKFTADQNEVSQQKIKAIQEECNGLNYTVSYDTDLRYILPRTTILITENSLVGEEASLNRKPVIVFNPTRQAFYANSVQYHKEGIALYATTLDELFQCISRILDDSAVNASLDQARKIFNYEINYMNDGKAANRIFNVLTKDN